MDVHGCLAEVTLDIGGKCALTPTVYAITRSLHVQVKQFAGKAVYKGIFLPLLRVYRQDQDVEKLTRGTFRNICHMTVDHSHATVGYSAG